MRNQFGALPGGLAYLPTAIAVVSVASLLPFLGTLLAELVWPHGHVPVTAAFFLAALIGWALAWHGGRWLARRAADGTDPRAAVLLAGAVVVSQLVRTGEGASILVGSIVFFSLPTVVAALAAGHEWRRLALPRVAEEHAGTTPRFNGRFLLMCSVSLALPLVLILVIGAISDAWSAARYHDFYALAGFLAVILMNWLLGRLLRIRCVWAPLRPAAIVVPVLLSQWPTLLASTEYQATMLAILACGFLLPCLAFLLGFGVFRRTPPGAAIP